MFMGLYRLLPTVVRHRSIISGICLPSVAMHPVLAVATDCPIPNAAARRLLHSLNTLVLLSLIAYGEMKSLACFHAQALLSLIMERSEKVCAFASCLIYTTYIMFPSSFLTSDV